ncbi:uncharacterized protein N7469_008451 [Penicillium citrinum]|uniref:Secreted protein n=1 Tax=Penicillium citrinum TaxID=5077 RepID=A0A9W9NLH4_PENCI|nr:uncharacterized protein N7469_008451 [Penicillium citrinum]KAJ5222211.1 hypothetical protein N7469_008451 [Penicillium citrinum]
MAMAMAMAMTFIPRVAELGLAMSWMRTANHADGNENEEDICSGHQAAVYSGEQCLTLDIVGFTQSQYSQEPP